MTNSTRTLIEDEFLRNAESNEIITWLKDNSKHTNLPVSNIGTSEFISSRKI